MTEAEFEKIFGLYKAEYVGTLGIEDAKPYWWNVLRPFDGAEVYRIVREMIRGGMRPTMARICRVMKEQKVGNPDNPRAYLDPLVRAISAVPMATGEAIVLINRVFGYIRIEQIPKHEVDEVVAYVARHGSTRYKITDPALHRHLLEHDPEYVAEVDAAGPYARVQPVGMDG